MARFASNKTAAKTSAASLRPLTDPEFAPPPARLHDRKLLPATFRPEAGRPQEADGAPLSRFGGRFREVFAAAHGIEPSDVDLGIVRQIEALSADHDRNLASLAVPQVKRTEHGTLTQVRMVVNTPLLFPWLLNGRALRRMGGELKGAVRLVTEATDHPVLRLPVMEVAGAGDVRNIVDAQRRLLGLDNYTTAPGPKKDRIDSIVQFGVLDPPDVVLTHVVSETGAAWIPQAAEGAQRLFSALLAMDVLANRDVSAVATDHWLRQGDARLRDFNPSDLRILEDSLKFSATAAAAYFPGRDQGTWLSTVAESTPAAVAFQLLRTMEINLVVAVDPDPIVTREFKNPVSETIQEMIRGYHMPGKAKDAWNEADINGMIAIGAIDEFAALNRINPEERSAWLGEVVAPWSGASMDEAGRPGNRLVAVTKMIASLTAEGALSPAEAAGDRRDSLSVVNQHLRLNGRRVHADDRAKVAAAQAIVALEMYRDGWENTLQAALFGAFRSSWFWKTSDHAGNWTEMLLMPVADLADAARRERNELEDGEHAGPAQRALAALGGVALMTNPGLIKAQEALTRTGLGGGGKATSVRASDPGVLLKTMVQHEEGINQLEDAIAALVASAEPTIPIDRETGERLSDFYLRARWLGSDQDVPDNPFTEFARQLVELIDQLELDTQAAAALRTILPGELIGGTRSASDEGGSGVDDGDLWGDPLYETVGIEETAADKAIGLLRELSDFFHTGKAYAKAAGRASR